MSNIIGERIVEGLNERKITQADLARMTGIDAPAISSYIKGRFSPKQDRIYSIAKALNVNEAWLLGITDKKERNFPFPYERPDETVQIISRAVNRMNSEEREKLCDVMKIMFSDKFD